MHHYHIIQTGVQTCFNGGTFVISVVNTLTKQKHYWRYLCRLAVSAANYLFISLVMALFSWEITLTRHILKSVMETR